MNKSKKENDNSKNKREIKHFSDLEHIWWGARTKAGQKRYDYKYKKLKKYCKPSKDFRVLEIGAGDGEFTRRISKSNFNIIATDITPVVVERGKKLLRRKNVKFKIENAEKLSFRDGSFDLICGVSILHHINIEKSLKEMFRVLKRGGQIFFTEPNLLNPNIFIGLNTPRLREKMEYSPDETALIRWKVRKMLKDIGFLEVKVVNYDFLHPLTPPKYIDLVSHIGEILEKTPLIKEISGSLIVWAKK